MAWQLLGGAARALIGGGGRAAAGGAARAGASASSSQFGKNMAMNALGSVLGGGGSSGGGGGSTAPAAPQPSQTSPIGQLPPKG